MILPLVVFGRSSTISTTRARVDAAMRSRERLDFARGDAVPGFEADDRLDRLAAIRTEMQ